MTNILFIKSFIEQDIARIYIKMEIFLVLWILVGIAVIIDLYFGIKRAKRIGIIKTSIGFRKTIKKGNQYGVFLTFAFLFDVILSIWFYPPFATAITSAFILFIEARSVWESMEKNDQKNYKEGAKDFIDLIRHIREDNKLLEEIKKKLEASQDTTNDLKEEKQHGNTL